MGKIKNFCPFFLVFMRAPANAPKLRFTNHDFPCYSRIVLLKRLFSVARMHSKIFIIIKFSNHRRFIKTKNYLGIPNKEIAEFCN